MTDIIKHRLTKTHRKNTKHIVAVMAITMLISSNMVMSPAEAMGSDPLVKVSKDDVERIIENEIDKVISETKAKWANKEKVTITKSNEVSNAFHFDFKLKVPIPFWWDPKAKVEGDLVLSCDENTRDITIKAINVKTKVDSKWYSEVLSLGLIEIIDDKIEDALESNIKFAEKIPFKLPFCPIIVMDKDGNIEVYSPMSSIYVVTMKITQVVQTDNPDGWGSGNGDYYAKIWINNAKFQTTGTIESKNFKPNWKFTENVNTDQNSLIPIHIELWDSDGFLNGKDEHMDINPNKNKKDIDFTYNVDSNKWFGDVTYPTNTAEGFHGGDKARITFEISSKLLSIAPEQPITPIPDWNEDGKGGSDAGDPLIFSITEKPANVIRNWSDQHKSFLTEFDLYNIGEKVTLSRTLDKGTMTLFLDLDGNGTLTDGTEWLYDQNENVYQILSRPLIDSNQNGWFDYSDELWNIAMVKDGEKYYAVSELGIVAFNWSNHSQGHGDMFGENRQYANCLYEGKYHYPDCKAVNENNFPLIAYNQNSVLLNDGRVLDSFGIVIGHLDMSKNNSSKQTQ